MKRRWRRLVKGLLGVAVLLVPLGGLVYLGRPRQALDRAQRVLPITRPVVGCFWINDHELLLLDWTGGEGSRSASDRLILAGVLAAGATAATGWSDWADAEQRDPAVRRSGLVHAAVNATATALMIGSWLARKRGARGRGRLLSLAGSAALGAGGWLGGHLSYTLGAGVTAGAPAAGERAAATTGTA